MTITAKNANGYTQSITQKWILGDVDPDNGDFDDIGIGIIGDMDAWSGYGSAQAFHPEEVKKITASGIPPGLKFSYSGYTATLEGYPSKPGKYTVNFTANMVDNTTKKARKTIIVKDLGSRYITFVSVSPNAYGEVKGSGVYKVGAKVPLSAKPAKDYLFAGWFTDQTCTTPLTSLLGSMTTASGDHRKASDSMTLYGDIADMVSVIFAKFIPKSNDFISLTTDLGSSDYLEIGSMQYDSTGGIDYMDYWVSSGTLPTVTAKKLPPGFTLDAKANCIRVDHSKIKPTKDGADVWVSNNIKGIKADVPVVWRTDKQSLFNSEADIINALENVPRLNVVLTDVETFTDEDFRKYKSLLNVLAEHIENLYAEGKSPQLNLLTDRMMLSNMNNCGAGDTTITLAPNGKFYVCPAFYYESEADCIGDLEHGPDIKNRRLYKLEYAPICRHCDAYQCKRCIWLNCKTTLEVNTPSREQCIIAHLERNASRDLLNSIRKHGKFMPEQEEIKEIDCLDPFDKKDTW